VKGRILLLCAALLLCGTAVRAEGDGLIRLWRSDHPLPLHWDNLEPSSAQWMAGARPEFDRASGWHAVSLGDGGHCLLALRPGQWLRLASPGGTLDPGSVQVRRSVDGRLFLPERMRAARDGSALFTADPRPEYAWVRIEPARARKTPLRLALFVSRAPDDGEVAGYRDELRVQSGAQAVTIRDSSGAFGGWRLSPGGKATLEVRGPQRLLMLSRLSLTGHARSRKEAYRIDVRLGDKALRVIELESGEERREAVEIDGRAEAVGDAEPAYVDIPPGVHRLALEVSRTLYLRLLGTGPGGGYLFPSNAARMPAHATDAVRHGSIWSLPEATLQELFSGTASLPEAERLAQRLARDNRWQAANLQAAHGLAGKHDFSLEQIERSRLAARRALSLQHYTDLLPDGIPSGHRQRALRFGPVFLAGEEEPAALRRNQLPALAGGIADLPFVALPDLSGPELLFPLPERDFDGQLRLVVAGPREEESAVFFLRMDDGPEQRLLLEPRQAALYRPDDPVLAEALLWGPGSLRALSPVRLAWGRIPLPAGVRSVRLRAGTKGCWTALQVQESSPYLGTESAYLAAVVAVGRERAASLFLEQLGGPGAVPASAGTAVDAAREELENLWRPLLRHLREQARYSPDPGKDTEPEDDPGEGPPAASLQSMAEQAEREGDWLLAIERWSRMLRRSRGQARDLPRWRRALALAAYGETSLAEREYWRLYNHADNSAMREAAMRELSRPVSPEEDAERNLRIAAAALLLRPGPGTLERTAAALADGDRPREALQVIALLPDAGPPAERFLAAARDEGWWSLFDLWVRRLPEGEEKRYWAAWPKVAQGDAPGALALWDRAGERGAAAARRLRAALSIRAALNRQERSAREQAVLAWEAWQAELLTQGTWRPAGDAVTAHAGGATLFQPALGLRPRYFRGTPSQGLRLSVYGPTRLRLEVRPLYPAGQSQPEDDWLTVRMGDRVLRYPVIANQADPERPVAQGDGSLAGRRVQVFVEVPPGPRQLDLSLGKREALFAVDRLEPGQYRELLPALTPERVRAALSREEKPGEAEALQWPVLLADEAGGRQERVELSLRTNPAEPGDRLPDELSGMRGSAATAKDAGPEAAFHDLLWQAQQEPARLPEIAARLERMFSGLPEKDAVRPFVERLRRDMAWKPVTNLWRRAGSRELIPPAGESQEQPAARLQNALLGPLREGEERVTGRNVLVLSLEQPRPADCLFEFRLEAVLQKPSAAMHVAVQVDGREEQVFRLDPLRDRASYSVRLEPGAHGVRIRIPNPVARHSVRVRIGEFRPARREYHVATTGEPLVVYAQGPSLVRVDEWRGDHTRSRYLQVDGGWQKLTFGVRPGEEEALYRVFQWTADRAQPPLPFPPQERTLPDLPAAPVALRAAAPEDPSPRSPLALGGQEDGTLSAALELAARRNLDEDTSGEEEKFVEARFSHRKFLEDRGGFHRLDLLGRLRKEGGPTFGARETLEVPLGKTGFDLELQGSLYLQSPGGEAGTEGLGEVRGRVSRRFDLGTRTFHRPAAQAFRRWMSLDGNPCREPGRVDQDVFTAYKRDHLHGITLEDDLFYRPWNDAILWVGGQVAGNEDLDPFHPDHLRVRAGARVLLRDLDLGAEYRGTRYLDDDDRRSSSTRQQLRLETQLWRWSTPRCGLQLRILFDKDLSSADYSAWLGLTVHRSNGRLFRDFRPGDVHFGELRQRIGNERLYGGGPGGNP